MSTSHLARDLLTLHADSPLAGHGRHSRALLRPIHPQEIASLRAWWGADTLTASDGDAIGSWADLSGLSNTASQGTADYKPLYKINIINGCPALWFDGSNDYLATASNIFAGAIGPTSDFTLMAVTRASGSDQILNAARFLSQCENNYEFAGFLSAKPYGGTPAWSVEVSKAGVADQTISSVAMGTDEIAIITGLYRSGSFSMRWGGRYLNTVAYNSTINGASANNRAMSIGAQIYNGTAELQYKGYIAEILIFGTELPDIHYRGIELYLARKYGLLLG